MNNNDNIFRGKLYRDVKKAISESSITFVTGPAKCGKTVCLKQLAADLPNAVYVNIKTDFSSDVEKSEFMKKIVKDMLEGGDTVYLLDDVLKMPHADIEIFRIDSPFSQTPNIKTRVVFADSNSKVLEFIAHLGFGGFSAFVRESFLSYPQWLEYRETTDVENYPDFLFNVGNFYSSFKGTKEYLRDYLNETRAIYNSDIRNIIKDDIENLDVEMLLNVLYAYLIGINGDIERFSQMLAQNFGGDEIDKKDLQIKISETLSGRRKAFFEMSPYDRKRSMVFLHHLGFITLTFVSEKLFVCGDFSFELKTANHFLREYSELYLKPDIFSNMRLTINHPMFCMDLFEKLIGRPIKKMPIELLCVIVEHHLRGLLSENYGYIYRDSSGNEVSRINLNEEAVEMSFSESGAEKLNLLPESYKKILLTRDISSNENGIERIPYYKYIYDITNLTDKYGRIW